MTPFLLAHQSPLPRIAMVSTHGYVAARPPLGAADTGGQVVYVLELSKKLAQLGHEVDIWTRQFGNQPETERVNDRVRVIRAPCGGPDFIPKEHLHKHLPEWADHALGLIRRHGLKYSLVSSHYWDAGLAGQRIGTALAVPHVHTPHSLGLWKRRQMEKDYPDNATTFEGQYNFACRIEAERQLYAGCQLVAATTPPQLDFLVNDYAVPPEKVRLVPPGYDESRFFPVCDRSRETIRARLGFAGRVVLALGRLARNKGYDLLISAFSRLARREPDAVLYLAIGGEHLNPAEQCLLAELRAHAELSGCAGQIRFLSFITDEELADYYRAADMFVLSSRYEPFGMTAIEAMASGTPTVVTVHGGLYQALSSGCHALFADPFDAKDLGHTMAKIFGQSRLSARLAQMGAEKVRGLFTWTGIAQQFMAALEPSAPLMQPERIAE